jgi:taurine transport system permease protein
MQVANADYYLGTKKPNTRVISVLTIFFLIMLWACLTYIRVIPALYLPSPLAVLEKLIEIAKTGYMDATLWQHLGASFFRIGVSLLIAILIGVPIGLAIGLNEIARAMLDPLIEFYRPVPPLAYLPLIVIWFGIGEFSKILFNYVSYVRANSCRNSSWCP